MQEILDTDLLRLIQKDDEIAFRVFYERYWERLYTHVYAGLQDDDEAKDIVQDIFIQVWNNRATLYVENTFEPYLFKTAKNQVFSLYRNKKFKLDKEEELIERLGRLEETDDRLMEKELNTIIDAELDKMPVYVRLCYQLSRKEGKSIREIAEKLSLSEQTVKNYISESLRRLRIELKNHSIEYLTLVFLISRH